MKKSKWFITAGLAFAMSVQFVDYPPTPPVQAQEQKAEPNYDWLMPEEKEEPVSYIDKQKREEQRKQEIQRQITEELLERERLAVIADNDKVMQSALANLESELGTPYVFSGSSPRGWDCSGLVRWFYLEHFGIELEHSATAQAFVGYEVDTPLPGDIVIFGYNERDFHHSSIYVGDNKVIHSGFRSGQRTEFLSLKHPSVENSYVKFVRLLETRP